MFSSVVFAAVFAIASVSASPTNGGGSSTSSTTVTNAPSVNSCNYTGGSVCCNSLHYASGAQQQTLLSLFNAPIDFNLLTGEGCSPLVGLGGNCNAQAACCEHTAQGIGAACNNLIF